MDGHSLPTTKHILNLIWCMWYKSKWTPTQCLLIQVEIISKLKIWDFSSWSDIVCAWRVEWFTHSETCHLKVGVGHFFSTSLVEKILYERKTSVFNVWLLLWIRNWIYVNMLGWKVVAYIISANFCTKIRPGWQNWS